LFLHNYIIPQKGCILSFSGCSLFFYSAFVFTALQAQERFESRGRSDS
jgi:hypothetical protein